MRSGRTSTRAPVNVRGKYRTGCGRARDVIVLDLSEGGCRFFDKFGSMKAGQVISLRVDSIGPINATVVWSTGSTVGAEFEKPLYGPVFEYIRDQVRAFENAPPLQKMRSAG